MNDTRLAWRRTLSSFRIEDRRRLLVAGEKPQAQHDWELDSKADRSSHPRNHRCFQRTNREAPTLLRRREINMPPPFPGTARRDTTITHEQTLCESPDVQPTEAQQLYDQ